MICDIDLDRSDIDARDARDLGNLSLQQREPLGCGWDGDGVGVEVGFRVGVSGVWNGRTFSLPQSLALLEAQTVTVIVTVTVTGTGTVTGTVTVT